MSSPLSGRRILVAEDLYLVALPICSMIELAGGCVVGPFSTSAACLDALASQDVDAAILDIGLSGGWVFPAARKLRRDGVPFLFLSGYGPETVPAEFAAELHLLKPCSSEYLCAKLAGLLQAPPASPPPSAAPGNP